METNPKRVNNLANEKSPYLLQHKTNPVNWYPWCDEAFELARNENKPIFLSIGYSTCHWCHVMAHESFEDSEAAEALNRAFVCIKVDREERPDIDSIYMKTCQILTGSGGWPLTIMLDHSRRPFFSGTYIPKTSQYGRIGLIELVEKVEVLWRSSPETITKSAESITNALTASSMALSKEGKTLSLETLERGYQQLLRMFDEDYGGFGDSPKFPTAHTLLFLLRYHHRTGEPQALLMVEKTLQEMSKGGIYDHIGDGFHRYSTDRKWLLPHFEKTLYDQAMLVMAYLEAYQLTGKSCYCEVAQRVLNYVNRELTDHNGGFYCGEDADSEGEEGKFYIWKTEEIKEILGVNTAESFCKAYNLNNNGNFSDERTGKQTGDNIPHITEAITDIDLVENARIKLFDHREQRPHPGKDDKILTDWNGLMIAALAKAGSVLNKSKYIDQAGKAVDFITQNLIDDSKLLHRYRDKESGIEGMLDDYAFLCWGLLELFEAGNDIEHLKLAVELTDKMIELFWSPEGGFYQSVSKDLIVRNKEVYDGAIPCGNSVAMFNLLKLSEICGKIEYAQMAEKMSKVISEEITKSPAGYCFWLTATDFALGPITNIIINGPVNNEIARKALDKIHSQYLPNKSVIIRHKDNFTKLNSLSQITAQLPEPESETQIYICRDKTCEPPVSDLDSLVI